MEFFGLKQKIANCIIRPPRPLYQSTQLGQSTFQHLNKKYQRIDFQVISHQIHIIQCSLYKERFKMDTRPTIIYLHGNSSNRLSAKNYLEYLIPKFDIIAFDFTGCGLSSGDFITLGYCQKENVRAVIEHTNHYYGKRKYVIWGRSMGAVTAILYTAKYNKIHGLVLDSPFADLEKVIYTLVNKNLPIIPSFIVESCLEDIEKHINAKIKDEYMADYKISKLKPIKVMKKIKSPVFFIAGKEDKLVNSQNVVRLYEETTSFKQLQILRGGHNESRPEHLKLTIIEFIQAALRMEEPQIRKKRIFSYRGKEEEKVEEKEEQKEEEREKKKKPKQKIFQKLSL